MPRLTFSFSLNVTLCQNFMCEAEKPHDMKYKFLVVPGVLFLCVLFLSSGLYRNSISVYKKAVNTPLTMCGTFLANWEDTTTAPAMIFPGLGDLRFSVTTSSSKAQDFFNQGLKLIYGFNHWEAIQSFRHAIKLDSDFAMGYWGLALAYGPNLNDINPQDRERLAYEAIRNAIKRNAKSTPFEKDFMQALATRYNGKSYEVRDSLNQAYSQAMTKLAKKYPEAVEAQTLCADAIMNTMPWDYWEKDGSPKPATQQAKLILENVLKKFPEHSGAHHLYIHLVEASPAPDQAMASAKFLETSMPGAGHIVHMPAHIYLRVGQYGKSIQSNEKAVSADESYLSISDNRGLYRLMYYPHNIDFISFSSYMQGRSDLALRTAMKLGYKGSLVAVANAGFAQYLMAEPIIAYTRFGKWNDILSLPKPDPNLIYPHVIRHFARGMALLRSDNLEGAEKEWLQLDSLSKLDTLKALYFSFNAASDIVQVPLHILKGELLLKQNKVNEGIETLYQAVVKEDGLRYNEPPDWKIFSRHYLGAALSDAGKYAEGEKIFQEDLKRNPENGWSLKGLEVCQLKQNNKSTGAGTAKRFEKAWKDADIKIVSARF